MIGVDAGAAWASLADGPGRVEAVFSRAVHIQLGHELLVLVDASGISGPLHLRVRALPAVRSGAAVSVVGGRLRLGQSSIDLRSVPAWTPPRLRLGRSTIDLRSVPAWTPPPIHGRPRAHRLPGVEQSAFANRPQLVSRVRTLLRLDDLNGLARLLGGWGPGLTPAGDDALAGVVLTLHALGGDESRLLAAVESVRSTDLALAYLRWAARGQCIEPAHALLAAVAGNKPEQIAEASARLCAHGASSGGDLLFGIDCALEGR
jgi:uncharacterized protein DUF2877